MKAKLDKIELAPGVAIPHARHPVWQKVKEVLVALSLTNLCLIPAWFSQLYDADFGYFNQVPVTEASLLALATILLGGTLLIWGVIRLLRRFSNRMFHFICHMLFVLLLLFPADFLRRTVFQVLDYDVYVFLKRPLVIAAIVVFFGLLVWQHRRIARVLSVVIGLLSPLALLILFKIALICLGVNTLAQYVGTPFLPPAGPGNPDAPRVVWLIFDEFDERLAFTERPPRLQMPEFDRLQRECLTATNAWSPGGNTLSSMPMLISGRLFSAVSIKNASDLLVTSAETNQIQSWSQLPSVFSGARQLGINTALVGWFHPYGRLLAPYLNSCVWYPYPPFESTRASTYGAALIRELSCLTGTFHWRTIYIDLCRSSVNASISLVTNANYGFVFLHLPMPHKPAVYDPVKGRYVLIPKPQSTGYFNNVALVDRTLGELRRAMKNSGEWDKTWLLISSDHHWRASKSYDGRIDWRVPFLLKAPGQKNPITYSRGFNTVLSHDLVLAILRGEISNADSAATWLDSHNRPEPSTSSQGLKGE